MSTIPDTAPPTTREPRIAGLPVLVYLVAAAVVLVAALAPGTGLYDKQFLGRTVNDALRANYRIGYVERDLYVYVPAGDESS